MRSISWLVDGILSIGGGIIQIFMTPLTWFIKIPMRGMITAVADEKDLLIENRNSIQARVNKLSLLSNSTQFKSKSYYVEYSETLNEIHIKYQKGINQGEQTLIQLEEKKLYDALKKEDQTATNLAHYLALFKLSISCAKNSVQSNSKEEAKEINWIL